MVKIESKFYYIGHCSVYGWGFGLIARKQAESDEEMKSLGFYSLPVDKNLYIVKTLMNKKAKKPYLISINNIPWTVTDDKRSPLSLIKICAGKIVHGWREKWPEYDFKFNNELRKMKWSDIKEDAMKPRYDAHKITEGIEHFLD